MNFSTHQHLLLRCPEEKLFKMCLITQFIFLLRLLIIFATTCRCGPLTKTPSASKLNASNEGKFDPNNRLWQNSLEDAKTVTQSKIIESPGKKFIIAGLPFSVLYMTPNILKYPSKRTEKIAQYENKNNKTNVHSKSQHQNTTNVRRIHRITMPNFYTSYG